jgi:hypothetical protein
LSLRDTEHVCRAHAFKSLSRRELSRAGGRGGLRGGSGGAASTLLPPSCGGSGEAELESLDLGAERGHLLGGVGPCGRGIPTRGGGPCSGLVSLSMLSHRWCGGASRRATGSPRHLPRDRRMRSRSSNARVGRTLTQPTQGGLRGSHYAGVGYIGDHSKARKPACNPIRCPATPA